VARDRVGRDLLMFGRTHLMPASSSRRSFGAAQTSLNDFFKKPKLNRTSVLKWISEDFEIPSSLPERQTQRERGQPERKKRKLQEDTGKNATRKPILNNVLCSLIYFLTYPFSCKSTIEIGTSVGDRPPYPT
jgi:hypothetical protein